jgi:hypothetical protein
MAKKCGKGYQQLREVGLVVVQIKPYEVFAQAKACL